MYTVQQMRSFSLRNSSQGKTWLPLATIGIIVCTLLALTTSFGGSLLHLSKPSAKATSPLIRRVNIPYFNSAVPFNQTAIFWFGDVTPTDTYTDVRMGYNSSELYISLDIVDQYLWYDTNKAAPDVNKGDNASVYLYTGANANSVLDQYSFEFQAAAKPNKTWSKYQKAYTGSGTTWTAANLPFTVVTGWQGHGFNGPQDSGWSVTYHIPFSSLGLSGPPTQSTPWKLAVQVHNQDNAAATPLPDKWWPEWGSDTNPAGWGDLIFGLPTYIPPPATTTKTYIIRNGLNGQVVTDGMVGGSLSCGNRGLNRWTQWGTQTYPGAVHVNIQNETYTSDWNCFSKFYITIPLSSLPPRQGVIKATITLYEYANAGPQGVSNPSYIQAATINEDWNPATLSWNTAPLVEENICSILVNTKSKSVIPWPGLPITWDISKAVADAYAAGQPLQLVFYSTDDQHNSGKYFTSSYVGNWDANGRPTLQVTLGS